jgi:sulfite reductase alpha subunit-like flavoprotein
MAAMASNEYHDSRTVLVAYATETGNSQDVAEDLGGLAERLHFKARVCELDAVKAVGTPNE